MHCEVSLGRVAFNAVYSGSFMVFHIANAMVESSVRVIVLVRDVTLDWRDMEGSYIFQSTTQQNST